MSPQPSPGSMARAAAPPAASQAVTLARRAALLVHGLSAADREWILAQLRDGERAALQGLLAELRDLGIPADRALIDEATGGTRAPARPPGAVPDPDRSRDPLLPLHGTDPDRMAAVLKDEPAGLVAHVLALRAWPWRAGLLDRLDAQQRADVEALLARAVRLPPDGQRGAAGPSPGDALREQLGAALLARVRVVDGTAPAAEGGGAERTAGTWLSRLLGRSARR